MCMFCRSLFVILFFFFWPLRCLSFDLRILITPLVSPNSSYNLWRTFYYSMWYCFFCYVHHIWLLLFIKFLPDLCPLGDKKPVMLPVTYCPNKTWKKKIDVRISTGIYCPHKTSGNKLCVRICVRKENVVGIRQEDK
jgi:hypothetical protein